MCARLYVTLRIWAGGLLFTESEKIPAKAGFEINRFGSGTFPKNLLNRRGDRIFFGNVYCLLRSTRGEGLDLEMIGDFLKKSDRILMNKVEREISDLRAEMFVPQGNVF